MKRSSLRTFGIACFIIGALYTTIDKFQLTVPFLTTNAETTSNIKKIAELEQQLSKANEQIANLEKNQSTTQNEPSSTAEENNNTGTPEPIANEEKTDDIVYGTLYIYSGVTPYDVGQKLENLGIVENGVEMELFLAKPQYSRSIQKGQFELNSSMSIEEMANIITGKVKKQ